MYIANTYAMRVHFRMWRQHEQQGFYDIPVILEDFIVDCSDGLHHNPCKPSSVVKIERCPYEHAFAEFARSQERIWIFSNSKSTYQSVSCLNFRLDDVAIPKGVVNENHTPGTEQLQQQFVVDIISGLVCIYEAHVEAALLAVLHRVSNTQSPRYGIHDMSFEARVKAADLQEALESLSGGRKAQVNLVLHSSGLPEWFAC